MKAMFNGKPVEVLDRLISPTTNRQIAIVREGLKTYPVDTKDFDSPDSVKIPTA